MYPYDSGNLFLHGTEHYEFVRDNFVGDVLDAGCGFGTLAEYVDEYTGIDATQFAVDNRVDDRVSFEFIENYKKQHDTVVALSVLETNELSIIDKLISLAKKMVIVSYTKGELSPEFKVHAIDDIACYFDKVIDGVKHTFFIKEINDSLTI